MEWLKGKKTMIGAIAAGVLVAAHAMGWVDDQAAQMIAAAILTWTGVSLRMAVGK
jgi:hypothetical protein